MQNAVTEGTRSAQSRAPVQHTGMSLLPQRQNRDLSLAHASFRFGWVLRGPLAVSSRQTREKAKPRNAAGEIFAIASAENVRNVRTASLRPSARRCHRQHLWRRL
jgi:hypothetical protein